MKNNVTEGAIVQHLAKLRTRRVEAGKDVPPPLRRGGVASSSKSAISRHGHVQTEGSNSESEELLVPGADFLQYPNDPEPAHVSDSSQPPEPTKSKLVVLRYRQSAGEHYSGFDSIFEQSVLGTYTNAPQNLPTPGLGMENSSILRYHPTTSMSAVDLGSAISTLASFDDNQDFHHTYADYANPVDFTSADEPTGLPSETVDSHGGDLYSDPFQYLYDHYIQSE
ncbi:hypothetical protein BDV28DRAFT_132994 [Aspergillus coremiiformis]|uniref:Uncharacterized protein n=1 Tax=Aspergillus coremiiformis TaxID=138285 RepID=A0A5N6Z8J9_9EURO|nr:hypothetical protein BDV28DRAFT_132994 [Aspergillus coremiiformis]